MAYLVRFVIVLWVILKHLCLFLVIESSSELVHTNSTKVFPPFLGIDEPVKSMSKKVYEVLYAELVKRLYVHLLGQLDVELACS